jgi:hypothetical protein
MACNLTLGYSLPCKNEVGGFRAIYLANFADYGFTLNSAASGHNLSSVGTLAEVYKYDLKNSGNSYVETINSNRDAGTTSFTQVMTAVVTGLNEDLDFQLKMMAFGRPIVFVETNGGKVFAMGVTLGAELSGTNKNIEGALEGAVNASLTLTATEPDPSYLLTSSAVTAMKALVVGQI